MARGWRVAASARRAEKLAQMATAYAAGRGGGLLVPMPCDITDGAQVQGTAQQIEALHGPIALAVLAAGDYKPDSGVEFSTDRLRHHMDLNVVGTGHCLEAVIPLMVARGRGRIAVVASVAGYRGLPRAVSYGASKAALINLAEALHLELAPKGVEIQVVNPGFVRTPLTDQNDFKMPALMEPADAARALIRGLDRGRFEITFPKRFTFWMRRLRCAPYSIYLGLVSRVAKGL